MLNKLTIKKTLKLLNSKKIKIEELYHDLYEALDETNKLNIFLALKTEKVALTEAKIKQHDYLKGLPLAVKDNFLTKDLVTTASSKVLEHFKPQHESTVSQKLQAAGGVIFGKTNLDAWAHGSSTETSDYGPTLNPRNTKYLPGGSSGGSAASVASHTCIAAIGSETAGSIRQPASWCGVVGLKPSYGRVSRHGVISMASSTDSPGPITKTVEDAALILNLIAGHDKYDGTSSKEKVLDYSQFINQEIKNLKIGILYHDLKGLEKITPLYDQAYKSLEKLGAKLEYTEAMDPRYAISVYTIIQRSEVASNLARFDGLRYGQDRSFFGDEAKRRIMLGTFTLSKGYADKYYNLASKVRTLFIKDFHKLFQKYDVLVAPTSPGFAKKLGATAGAVMFGELEDMLLEPSSITGLPGINVPCYLDPKTNLYLGLNIMAPMFREDLVIRVGDAFEKATTWNSFRKEAENE